MTCKEINSVHFWFSVELTYFEKITELLAVRKLVDYIRNSIRRDVDK